MAIVNRTKRLRIMASWFVARVFWILGDVKNCYNVAELGYDIVPYRVASGI